MCSETNSLFQEWRLELSQGLIVIGVQELETDNQHTCQVVANKS